MRILGVNSKFEANNRKV